MHRFRQVVIAASVTALALAAFGAPASAGPGKATIGIVNGYPNEKVDICVNGKELRSGAKYGQAVTKVVQAGSKKVKIFKKDPRTCKGTKLGKKVINLPVGSDFTLVFTKKSPRWVKFNNGLLGQIWPKGPDSATSYMAWRHAADLGTVAARYIYALPSPAPSASVENPWTKGLQFQTTVGPWTPGGIAWALAFGRVDKPGNLAVSRFLYPKSGYRYEFYLLGTWAGNAKVIIWKRPITAPTP